MWRVLTQLPTLISEVIGHLRTISYLTQQSLLLQQETNSLLREMIVKVTTQPAETPTAVTLDQTVPVDLGAPRAAKIAKVPYRIRTERDITRNTRASIAEEQFRQKGLQEYPHRVGEQLPTSPNQSPTPTTRPLGTPPSVA